MEIQPMGKKARDIRRDKIAKLFGVVKGNRGWRPCFYEKYPQFNSEEGVRVVDRGIRGICDDPSLLSCLEEFIPWVQETAPQWYVKHFQISIPQTDESTTANTHPNPAIVTA